MKARFGKAFEKQYATLDKRIKSKFAQSLAAWMEDPYASVLNNHALRGKFKGYRSINVTGDFRAIYRLEGNDTGIFVAIGKHSHLYE